MGKISFNFLKKLNWNLIPIGVNTVLKYGKQHLPTIMSTTGIIGFWASGAMLITSIPKAEKAIEQDAVKRKEENLNDQDRLDRYKIYAEYCWPSVAAATASTVLVFGADRISVSKLLGMTGLYQSAKNELNAITERVESKDADGIKVGDLRKARHDMHVAEYEKDPVKDTYDVYETGKGNTLFVEVYSGARFHSSMAAVTTAISQLNAILQNEQYVSLEDFYDLLQIDYRSRKCGKYAAFRLNTTKDIIHPEQVLDYSDYVDPTTGEPRICFIDISRFLTPSDDFYERSPW